MSLRSKLQWRCRRGVKELDVVLTRYLETRYDGDSEAEQAAFGRLLDLQDPDILRYLFKQEEPEDMEVARLIQRLSTLTST